jgi:hypothetical protein
MGRGKQEGIKKSLHDAEAVVHRVLLHSFAVFLPGVSPQEKEEEEEEEGGCEC